MKEWLRNLGIWIALNPLDDLSSWLISGAELDSMRDRIGRLIESFEGWLWRIVYFGSQQEIDDALNYSEEAWPSTYMSERQKEARRNAPEDSFYKQTLKYLK